MSTLEAVTEESMTALAEGQNSFSSPVISDVSKESDASSGFDALPEFVEPSCYSFVNPKVDRDVLASGAAVHAVSTKVGQTLRIISVRILEWKHKEHYEEIVYVASLSLKLDIVDDNGDSIYTDDHSLHKALVNKGFIRTVKLLANNGYYPEAEWSREFYTDVTGAGRIVDEALLKKLKEDITADYTTRKHGYRYLTPSKEGGNFAVKRQAFQITDYFPPRGYQKKTVKALFEGFMGKPLSNHQLLYSPTRSGKSVMAAWYAEMLAYSTDSPLYEKTMAANDGNVFVVVSGKVDVKSEWQETFQAHNDFAKKNTATGKQKFAYIDAEDMKDSDALGENIFDDKFKTADNVIVFLSLQDLAGSANHESKSHHSQLIGRVSYVIGDECHFGMFGDSKQYSRALKNDDNGLTNIAVDRAEEGFKQLNPEHGSLYISATPFSILVNGGIEGFVLGSVDGASKGNVVVVSPSEIKNEADKWLTDNPDEPEWRSDYFGMVEQHYFAVNVGDINSIMLPKQEAVKTVDPVTKRKVPVISESGNQVMRDIPELQNEPTAKKILSKLFLQINDSVDSESAEVLDDIIEEDASVDNVPNFFVNEGFLNTGAGKHLLVVVPRRASADAVERILYDLGIASPYAPGEAKETTSRYTSLNLTSADESHTLAGKSISELKQVISTLADEKKMTISITVNKATTGVSVKQWDTTLMMSKSDSMEKTTQVMGRQNTPNVVTLKGEDENGDEVKTRHALKQHTAFISFDHAHLYETVERLDRFYEQAEGKDPDRQGRKSFSSGRIWDCTSAGLRELSVNDVRESLYKHLADNGVGSLARSLPFDLSKIDGLNAIEHQYLVNRGLKAKGNSVNMTLFELLENNESVDGDESNANEKFLCTECEINYAVFGQDTEAEYSDASLCIFCNVKTTNKQAYENAVINGDVEFDAVNSDGENVSVNTAGVAVANTSEGNDDLFSGAFDGIGEDSADTGSEKTLAKEAKRIAKEKKKQDEEIRDNLRGIQTTMLIYVAVSRWGKNGEGEWTIDEIKKSLKNNKSAQFTAERIGLRKEDLGYLLKFADTGVINSQIFTVRNHLLNESLSKWDRLRFVIKDLPSVSANEVFTPDHVAELLIDILGFNDDDFMRVLENDGNKPDEGGFLDIGSKEAALLVEINKRSLKAIENNVESGSISQDRAGELRMRLREEKLVCLPSSSMTYEIIHKVYRDHRWNTKNILYTETGKNISNWALGIITLHENFAKMESCKKSVEAGENQRSVDNAIRDLEKLNQEREQTMTELGAPDEPKNKKSREGIDKIVSRMNNGFDVVVGNPPYQISTSSGESRPIYADFALRSHFLAEKVALIHPLKWAYESKNMSGFRGTELSSNKYKSFVSYPDSDFFEGAIIEGGVCYYLWDKNHDGKTDYFHKEDKSSRDTLLNGKSVFMVNNKYDNVISKITSKNHISPFGWTHYGKVVNSEEQIEKIEIGEIGTGILVFFFSDDRSVSSKRITSSSVSKDTSGHKVFASTTAHSDTNKSLRRLNRIFYGKEDEIVSSSFIQVARFDTKKEAENLIRYLKTDFAVFLFGLNNHKQTTNASSYRLIPDINPATGEIKDKPGEKIDFTVDTVDEIDDQLAKIYELTDDERELMRNSIKPWKDKNSLTADGLY